MQHAGLAAVIVIANKIEVGVIGHIRCRHRDVLVARNVGAGRVIDLVVGSGGDREGADIALAVVHHRVNVGRKHRLVVVVHMYCWVGPPQKGLRLAAAVVELDTDLKIGAVGMERKAVHTLGEKHALDLRAPDRAAAVGVFGDAPVERAKGAGAVVLRPVELNAARDPRPGQAHQRGLDHLVVVNEMIAVGFIERHLYAAAQLGQDHDAQVAIFQKHCGIRLVGFLVEHAVDHRVRVDHAAAALVDAFFQEHRVAVGLADGIGRDYHRFGPGANGIGAGDHGACSTSDLMTWHLRKRNHGEGRKEAATLQLTERRTWPRIIISVGKKGNTSQKEVPRQRALI